MQVEIKSDDELNITISGYFNPEEKQMLEYPGCPAHFDDVCVEFREIDLTEKFTKKELEYYEMLLIDSLNNE